MMIQWKKQKDVTVDFLYIIFLKINVDVHSLSGRNTYDELICYGINLCNIFSYK